MSEAAVDTPKPDDIGSIDLPSVGCTLIGRKEVIGRGAPCTLEVVR
jgi:hypothetical protein